jgi:hypothetical protein
MGGSAELSLPVGVLDGVARRSKSSLSLVVPRAHATARSLATPTIRKGGEPGAIRWFDTCNPEIERFPSTYDGP